MTFLRLFSILVLNIMAERLQANCGLDDGSIRGKCVARVYRRPKRLRGHALMPFKMTKLYQIPQNNRRLSHINQR